MKYHKYSNCALKCTDWSPGTIRQLSDATQRCSRSPTKVQNYDNNGRNCTQHSANRIDDYYVTYGHSVHHVEHNAQGTRAVDSGARPPPQFHVWPADCCIHPILYFKNFAPPSGFWLPLLLNLGDGPARHAAAPRF